MIFGRMRPSLTSVVGTTGATALAGALRSVHYEVLPMNGIEDAVVEHVPGDVVLTVTTTSARGLDATLDLAVELAKTGYVVKPHVPARLVRDHVHLDDVVARLRDADVRGIVVVAGDVPEPVGDFADSISLMERLDMMGRPFDTIGVAGYPEGHGRIPREDVDSALLTKAPFATYVITQMCFDASTILRWARRAQLNGVTLPMRIGVPGAVSRRRLVRISSGLGLGQSARFLEKQQSLLWRFFLPHGYSPDQILTHVSPAIADPKQPVDGLHLFTFNELQKTERWRQDWLDRLDERNGTAGTG